MIWKIVLFPSAIKEIPNHIEAKPQTLLNVDIKLYFAVNFITLSSSRGKCKKIPLNGRFGINFLVEISLAMFKYKYSELHGG